MKKIFLVLLSTYFISCNETQKEPLKEPLKGKSEIEDSINISESALLTVKRNAISDWDTTVKYTYQLQEMFNTGSRLVSFIGPIKDIIKKDSNYIMKVYGDYPNTDNHYFAEIIATPTKFNELYKTLIAKSHYKTGCFIIKNVKVKSTSTLTIDSEISDTEEGEDPSSYLSYGFDGTLFIFKGDLVDFYLYKEL